MALSEQEVWHYHRRYTYADGPSIKINILTNGMVRIIPRSISDLKKVHPRTKFVRVLYWINTVEFPKAFWRRRFNIELVDARRKALLETGCIRPCDRCERTYQQLSS